MNHAQGMMNHNWDREHARRHPLGHMCYEKLSARIGVEQLTVLAFLPNSLT